MRRRRERRNVSLLPLIKFCEENEIKLGFWFGKGRTITGVPKYEGFNIDVGQMLSVDGTGFALHDFKSLLIVNPDHHLYREFYA